MCIVLHEKRFINFPQPFISMIYYLLMYTHRKVLMLTIRFRNKINLIKKFLLPLCGVGIAVYSIRGVGGDGLVALSLIYSHI